MPTRRKFVKDSALLGAASLVGSGSAHASSVPEQNDSSSTFAPLVVPRAFPAVLAQDETFWKQVAQRYRVTDGVTNMEAG